MMNDIQYCSCNSRLPYQHCCEPFHLKHKVPITAEQLMRSRYCAYTKVNIDYIVSTTVPGQQVWLDRNAMFQWGSTTKWQGLKVIAHNPYFSKKHSTVEFKAYFETDAGIQVHHELSLFVKIAEQWYFVDPNVALPSQKQPCICGSGKKFKHCCGVLSS